MPDLTSDLARFWAKVDKTETCWLWTASLITGGYGAFTSLVLKTKIAHRFAYLAFVGPIPAGKELDHTCHVPRCVNPEHLRPVSKLANQHNRKGANRTSTSGYRNVSYIRRARSWGVVVTVDRRTYRKQGFKTAEDANAYAVAWRPVLLAEALRRKNGAPRKRPRTSGQAA